MSNNRAAPGGPTRRFDAMSRVLVTEEIAPDGLDLLREAGHDVDVQLGLDDAGLLAAVPGANALIIRSATTVTAAVLRAGSELRVIGRTGIGLDNVDVDAATDRGVLVCNAPFSNAVSAAEHTLALMLAVARNIAPAHVALTAGRWERSRWKGVELDQKVLGIIGLGRIGRLVGDRARAFGMTLIAYDPYVSAESALESGATLVDLETLMATADFVSLHLTRTTETLEMIDADLLAKAKPGQRIVNVSRNRIIDEQALADVIVDGSIVGAGLDVFATEPATRSSARLRTHRDRRW